jgi:hypothetical protein
MMSDNWYAAATPAFYRLSAYAKHEVSAALLAISAASAEALVPIPTDTMIRCFAPICQHAMP